MQVSGVDQIRWLQDRPYCAGQFAVFPFHRLYDKVLCTNVCGDHDSSHDGHPAMFNARYENSVYGLQNSAGTLVAFQLLENERCKCGERRSSR